MARSPAAGASPPAVIVTAMAARDATPPQGADWLRPRLEQPSLERYVQTIRERWWLVLLAVVLTVVAAGAYLAVAEKVYEAEADVLVTPVPGNDPTLAGLGLPTESNDPTRVVETASRFVHNREVARRVRARLRLSTSPGGLLDDVTAEPVAGSNFVAVTAQADSPRRAQQLANAFAEEAVADRTDEFHRQLDEKLGRLRQAPQGTNRTGEPGTLAAQIALLQTLRAGPDPTVRVQTRADLPISAASPKPRLTIAAALLGGLILGVGAVFALQVLDPRLRREQQLRNLYGLPILARIPRQGRRARPGALAPQRLDPPTVEAYRTLRATITAHEHAGPRSILVTSASSSEGKTTTAINLASSLALAGHQVLLIEADLRRPAVGRALDVVPTLGTGDVLVGSADLRESLVTTKAYGRYLQLLLARNIGGASAWVADRLFLPAAQRLIGDAKRMADYVIIDSPPLTEVIDALPLAQRADDVLLVVRAGRTMLGRLSQLAELLARHEIDPTGFVMVGVPGAGGEGYYYASEPSGPSGVERSVAASAAGS